jgi:two-component system response regulator FixJ
VVEGLTNKEIGKALGLSPRTVEAHRAHLFEKLEVASLAQLVRTYARWRPATAPRSSTQWRA